MYKYDIITTTLQLILIRFGKHIELHHSSIKQIGHSLDYSRLEEGQITAIQAMIVDHFDSPDNALGFITKRFKNDR